VEVTGNEDKVRGFLTLVKPLGIKEVVRTGPIAVMRGEKATKAKERQSKGGNDGEGVL
jgi:acetolactate synthase-1/3 small subunit